MAMAGPISPSSLCDLVSFRNEWSVLLECASRSHDRERLQGLLRSADWARLLVLAEEHGVAGHLRARLQGLREDLVPPEIRQTLVDRQRAQIVFTLRLTTELFRLLDRFTSEGIGVLVVKGPVLAVQAYGDPAMRAYGDLDLLVRQRDIRRATELMMEAGYESRVPLSAIAAGKIPGQYLFFKPDAKLIVELHNDSTLRYFPRRLPLEEFLARQIRVRLDSREAPALSVEDELVLVSIHGAKHFWERLLWIADLAALVSRQTGIDWNHVQAMVDADVVAARLAEQTSKWLPAAGYLPRSLIARVLFRMRMRGGLIAAPAYLLRLSFSPTEEDWNEEGRGSGHRLSDVVRRPFRLARKYRRDGKS